MGTHLWSHGWGRIEDHPRKKKAKEKKKVKQWSSGLRPFFDQPSPSLSNRLTLDHSRPLDTTQEQGLKPPVIL